MSLKPYLFAALFAVSTVAHAEEVNLGASGKAAVQMAEVNGEFVLSIRLPAGNIQKIKEEFVPFEMEGAPAAIAILDLNGDGVEEFVVRAMIPPQSGALYVYTYSVKEKKFVPMVTGKEADDTFLPVDAVAPVAVDRTGHVKARIAIRTEMSEHSEDREYNFVKGKFKRVR
ncbi:MAG: FG-GAP repeat protein [Bdellovibrionota bacterium]